jgi:hypothetical protein
MARKNDREKILKHLRTGKRLTALEAFKTFTTLSLAQHIGALRKRGWIIQTEIKQSDSGKRYAEYYINKGDRK